jgi:uncharacterized protein DUF2442
MHCTCDDPRDRLKRIRIEDDRLTVDLADGRIISVPLSYYPAVHDASPADRAGCRPLGDMAIEWPALDYQLSVFAILHGLREEPGHAAWRREHPIGSEIVIPEGSYFPRTSHSPRRAKRAASLNSAALPGRRKRKPAASRTKSVASRTRKSGLKTKR